MKKIIYAAIAAIGLWLSPGCSNEEELLGSGDEAQVSFTVNLADGIQTKAIADGTKAKNLVVGVFEKVGESYQEVSTIRHKKDGAFTVGSDSKITATVDFKLMKGKSYSFIFWAQSQNVENDLPTSPYYDLTDLQDIKVSYDGATANDENCENRDAFLGVVKDYEVTRDFTEKVELKRPFAQLNFMVTKEELDKAAAAGLIIENSSITLSQVAQKLQPLKGTVSEYQENVTFAAAPVSIDMTNITASDTQTLPKYDGTTGTDTYYYLATTYFLVAANDESLSEPGKGRATLTSANMKIDGAEGNGLTANSVPVQWNYRTNIYGPLLTAPGTFKVKIEEGFNGDDYNEYQESVTVNAISDVAAAIERGATTITVKDKPTSDVPIEIPKVVDGDNKNITINLPELGTSKITIEEQTTDAEAGEKIPAKVNVNTTSADNVEIILPNSTVTLNGGTYSNVTATTKDETLIVSEGVTIENLQVMKGKVRIEKGGNVGTITRAEGNEDATTYVYIEDGGILVNMPDASAPIIVVATVGTNAGVTYAINKGITTIRLTPGTYIIPDDAKGKTLTFIGTGNPEDTKIATQDDGSYEGCDYSLDGATVTFENITIHTDSHTYTGYARCNGTYKNCVINGTYTLYGESKFENCTFNVSGNVYNIWTWGAKDIVFDGCTFNSDGKALLLYQEGTNTVNLTVTSCIFNDNGGLTDKKAAIEIGDAPYGATPTYNVTVSGTTVNGYEINDKGINTGTTLWGNKNSMPADRLNVTVDGVVVY